MSKSTTKGVAQMDELSSEFPKKNEEMNQADDVISQWRAAHKKPLRTIKTTSETDNSLDWFWKEMDSLNKTAKSSSHLFDNSSSVSVSQPRKMSLLNTTETSKTIREDESLTEKGSVKKIESLITALNFGDESSIRFLDQSENGLSDDSGATWSFHAPEQRVKTHSPVSDSDSSFDSNLLEDSDWSVRCDSRAGFCETSSANIPAQSENVSTADDSRDSFNESSDLPALNAAYMLTPAIDINHINESFKNLSVTAPYADENVSESIGSKLISPSVLKETEQKNDNNMAIESGKTQDHEVIVPSNINTSGNERNDVQTQPLAAEPPQKEKRVTRSMSSKPNEDEASQNTLNQKSRKKKSVLCELPQLERRVTRSMTVGNRKDSKPEPTKTDKSRTKKTSKVQSAKNEIDLTLTKPKSQKVDNHMSEAEITQSNRKTSKSTKTKNSATKLVESEVKEVEKRVTRSRANSKPIPVLKEKKSPNPRKKKTQSNETPISGLPLEASKNEIAEEDLATTEEVEKPTKVDQETQTEFIDVCMSAANSQVPELIKEPDDIHCVIDEETQTVKSPSVNETNVCSSDSIRVFDDYSTPYNPRSAGRSQSSDTSERENWFKRGEKPVTLEILPDVIFTPVPKRKNEMKAKKIERISETESSSLDIGGNQTETSGNPITENTMKSCSLLMTSVDDSTSVPAATEKTFDLFGSSFVEKSGWEERIGMNAKSILSTSTLKETHHVDERIKEHNNTELLANTPKNTVLVSPVQMSANSLKVKKRKSHSMKGENNLGTNENGSAFEDFENNCSASALGKTFDLFGSSFVESSDWREKIGLTNHNNSSIVKRAGENDEKANLQKNECISFQNKTNRNERCNSLVTERTINPLESSIVDENDWREVNLSNRSSTPKRYSGVSDVNETPIDNHEEVSNFDEKETFSVHEEIETENFCEVTLNQNDSLKPIEKLLDQSENAFIDKEQTIPNENNSDFECDMNSLRLTISDMDIADESSKDGDETESPIIRLQEHLTNTFYNEFWKHLARSKRKRSKFVMTMIMEEDEPTYISLGRSENEMSINASCRSSMLLSSTIQNQTITIDVTRRKSQLMSHIDEDHAEQSYCISNSCLEDGVSRPYITNSFVQNEVWSLKKSQPTFALNPFTISPVLNNTITVDVSNRRSSLMLSELEYAFNEDIGGSFNSSVVSDRNRTHTLLGRTFSQLGNTLIENENDKSRDNTHDSGQLRNTFTISPILNSTVTIDTTKRKSTFASSNDVTRKTDYSTATNVDNEKSFDPSKCSFEDEDDDWDLKEMPDNLNYNLNPVAISPILDSTITVDVTRRKNNLLMSRFDEYSIEESDCTSDMAMIENETISANASKRVSERKLKSNSIEKLVTLSPILNTTITLDATCNNVVPIVKQHQDMDKTVVRTPRIVCDTSPHMGSFDFGQVMECLSAKSLKEKSKTVHAPTEYSNAAKKAIIFDLTDCDEDFPDSYTATNRVQSDEEMDTDSEEDIDDFRPEGTPTKLLSKSPFVSSPSNSAITPQRKNRSIIWNDKLENHDKLGLNDPRDSLKKLPSRSILITPKRHKSISAKLNDLYDDLSQRKRILDAKVL